MTEKADISPTRPKRLVRSKDDRMIAGICAGLGRQRGPTKLSGTLTGPVPVAPGQEGERIDARGSAVVEPRSPGLPATITYEAPASRSAVTRAGLDRLRRRLLHVERTVEAGCYGLAGFGTEPRPTVNPGSPPSTYWPLNL